MIIRDLFQKPINRPINGVIKADQMDAASVWQELEEYVVTKQISEYLRKFFDAYLAAIDSPQGAAITDRMGGQVQVVERFNFVGVKVNQGLTDADFSVDNPAYNL